MNFQERFKGKTSVMTKNGPAELLTQTQNSIPKFSDFNKQTQQPLKLPLQTYNPKYPPTTKDKGKDSTATINNPFLVHNPYNNINNNNNEDMENQQQNGSNHKEINNYQAHYMRGSPSVKNSSTSSYKDILVNNSRNIMGDNVFEIKDNINNKRPPSYDNINPKIHRKANTANAAVENDTEFKYKPYTIKDYNEIQRTAFSTSQKGLGPNINTEDWLMRKEKLEKMMNFSQNVKLFNSKKLSEVVRIDANKEAFEKAFMKSKREKAIEFAKNIPRPVIPVKKQKFGDGTTKEQEEFKDELQLLEKQHLKLLNEIEHMNNGGGNNKKN